MVQKWFLSLNVVYRLSMQSFKRKTCQSMFYNKQQLRKQKLLFSV